MIKREIVMQYVCEDFLSASTTQAAASHTREGSGEHTFHFSTHEQDTERRAGYLIRMIWLGQGRDEFEV